MDFRQMFDTEEVSVCLNEACTTDDIFALMYEANQTNVKSVKTPNGVTELATLLERIMQGDVLSPFMYAN